MNAAPQREQHRPGRHYLVEILISESPEEWRAVENCPRAAYLGEAAGLARETMKSRAGKPARVIDQEGKVWFVAADRHWVNYSSTA